jgi:hypothetical protein
MIYNGFTIGLWSFLGFIVIVVKGEYNERKIQNAVNTRREKSKMQ